MRPLRARKAVKRKSQAVNGRRMIAASGSGYSWMSSTAGLRLLADHPVSPCVDRVVHAIRREVGAGGPHHRASLYVDLPVDIRVTEPLEARAAHLRALQ